MILGLAATLPHDDAHGPRGARRRRRDRAPRRARCRRSRSCSPPSSATTRSSTCSARSAARPVRRTQRASSPGHAFFPHLIAAPFRNGLHAAFALRDRRLPGRRGGLAHARRPHRRPDRAGARRPARGRARRLTARRSPHAALKVRGYRACRHTREGSAPWASSSVRPPPASSAGSSSRSPYSPPSPSPPTRSPAAGAAKPPKRSLASAVHGALTAKPVTGVSAQFRIDQHLLAGTSTTLSSNPLLAGATGSVWVGGGHARLVLNSQLGTTARRLRRPPGDAVRPQAATSPTSSR